MFATRLSWIKEIFEIIHQYTQVSPSTRKEETIIGRMRHEKNHLSPRLLARNQLFKASASKQCSHKMLHKTNVAHQHKIIPWKMSHSALCIPLCAGISPTQQSITVAVCFGHSELFATHKRINLEGSFQAAVLQLTARPVCVKLSSLLRSLSSSLLSLSRRGTPPPPPFAPLYASQMIHMRWSRDAARPWRW